MELVVFILALCALAWLAAHFGVDSRDLGVRSPEEVLARHGSTWGAELPTPLAPSLAIPPAASTETPARGQHTGRAHALRHPLAVALYRLAYWLAPDTSRAATT